MNLLVGANASGKSNLLEALRVLQGIGNGFTIAEVLDGKPKSATSGVWDGIRGGSTYACSASAGGGEVTIEVHGRLEAPLPDPPGPPDWEYRITFSPATGKIGSERLARSRRSIYDFRSDARIVLREGGRPFGSMAPWPQPILGQIAEHVSEANRPFAERVPMSLADMQRVGPTPTLLRAYSRAHTAARMGDNGENFAAVVQAICRDVGDKEAYLSWLQQLRPDEVDDVGVLHGALGEPLFMLREGHREFPAPVLSDGTLRFAAMAAVFFQPDMPDHLTIEEIENGLHASRLRLLIELLRSQAEFRRTQVVATTHSPIVVEWLDEAEYATTFLCRRDPSTGESTIRSLTDVPHFMEAVKRQSFADLLAEGWLEMAL